MSWCCQENLAEEQMSSCFCIQTRLVTVTPPEAPLVHPESLIKKITVQRGQETVPAGPPDEGRGHRRAPCSFCCYC